jgi:hypothetical protein
MRASRSNLSVAAVLVAATALLLPVGPTPASSQPICDELDQTEGPDILMGTEGSDVICGLGGEDQIEALGGVDLVYGGPDVDTISGGSGDDYLDGGPGDDTLDGGAGADVCVSDPGMSCHPKNPPDPNDAGGILDVKRVRIDAGDRWSWRVVTRGKWSLRRMWDDGYVIIWLDTRNNRNPDFYLLGRSAGGRMRGTLFRDRTGRDVRIGGVKVTHPGRRVARFLFDLDRIAVDSDRDYIRWSAQTILVNAACSRSCFDRVTNEGAVPMPLD